MTMDKSITNAMMSRSVLRDTCISDWNQMQALPTISQQLITADKSLAACIEEGSPTDYVFCDVRTDSFRNECNSVNGYTMDIYWEVLGNKYIESVFQQCFPQSCANNSEDLEGLLWSYVYQTFCEGPYWRTGLETACCNVNYYDRVMASDNGGHYRKQCHPTESIRGAVICDTLYFVQACCYSDAGCPGALWGCSERWGYPCPYASCLPQAPSSQWIGDHGRYFLFIDWTGEPVYLDVDIDAEDWIMYYHERDCEKDGASGYSTSCTGKDANGNGLGISATLTGKGFDNNKGPSGENGFLFTSYSTMEVGTDAKTLFDMYTYYYVCYFSEEHYTFGRDTVEHKIDESSLPQDKFIPADGSSDVLHKYGRPFPFIIILLFYFTLM